MYRSAPSASSRARERETSREASLQTLEAGGANVHATFVHRAGRAARRRTARPRKDSPECATQSAGALPHAI
jgi:hypothetical protein